MSFAYKFFVIFMLVCPGPCSSFTAFGEYEYFVDNRVVSSYSAAEQQCAQADATLAIVNSQNITNFLVQQIGNLSGEYSITEKQFNSLDCRVVRTSVSGAVHSGLISSRTDNFEIGIHSFPA